MTSQNTLRPKYGTQVTGKDFWPGTRPDPDILVDRLTQGESVKSFGLRRIGKSSLTCEAKRRLDARGRLTIRLDGQELHSVPVLLNEIIAKLPAERGLTQRLAERWGKLGLPPEVKAKVKALVTEKVVGTSEPALDAYAELLFKELGAAFAALPPEQKPVLFIDELPWFCDNVMRAAPAAERSSTAARLNNLLAVLRNWRSEDVGVAMAVSGSLSMTWLQRQHDIQVDHVNDCVPVEVEELPAEQAVAMVKAMIAHTRPRDWQEGVAERLCALLPSLYPGVVQFAFSVIRYTSPLTVKDLEDVYSDEICDGLQANYYSQFDKRIGHFTEPERAAAYKLFAAISAGEGAVSWQEAEACCGTAGRILLDRLAEDGFLRNSRKAGVRFASGLARNWHNGGE